MGTTTQGSWNGDGKPHRGDRPVECSGATRLSPLVEALKAHPGLDPADRCLALHAIKKALCPCFELCDRWVRELAGPPRTKTAGL